jgi:DNA-binding transcriptional ArsR family regulator
MVKTNKANKEMFERSARIYKLMANAKRLEILDLLSNKEMTVTELVNTMGVRKANVSQQLAILRYIKLVTVKRVGKNAFYKIADKKIAQSFKTMNACWKNSKVNI